MRTTILFLFAITALLFTSCSRSTAGLQLEGRQQFVLGEYMESTYTASMRNDGTVPVTVTTVDKATKDEIRVVELAVNDRISLTVPPDEEARLYNYTDRRANIYIVMNKTVEGMRNVDLDGNELPREARAEADAIADMDLFRAKSIRPPVSEHDVSIPAGHEFVVGEATSAEYAIEIRNFGGKDITISVRDKTTGRQTQGFGMGIYYKAMINLGPNEQLHVENRERVARRVKLELSQAVGGARMIPLI